MLIAELGLSVRAAVVFGWLPAFVLAVFWTLFIAVIPIEQDVYSSSAASLPIVLSPWGKTS